MSTYYQTGEGFKPKGSANVDDLVVPSCSIEDVDRALFNLFNVDLDLFYKESNKNSKRIPVIFATGERFAILRRKKPLRDKAGALILPLVSILRNWSDAIRNQRPRDQSDSRYCDKEETFF